jgi:deoxyxylulose-5-phosphate synthase
MAENANLAIEKSGIRADFIKLLKVKPLDISEIAESVKKTGILAVLEDVTENGSVGQRILAELAVVGVFPKRVLLRSSGNGFVTHGNVTELWKMLRLDADSFAEDIHKFTNAE